MGVVMHNLKAGLLNAVIGSHKSSNADTHKKAQFWPEKRILYVESTARCVANKKLDFSCFLSKTVSSLQLVNER